ncbi:EGF-like domain-containing protein [Artemisia annua]|uniref:EGF-like domain-containing protein n=1 Tax=Artemisia annua TaxID=35608 RepID=A0A2U1MQG4_ARTAN|nr:EGF-like domain-containing protein [Artemisia annua]
MGPTAQKQGSNKKKQTTIIVVSAPLGSVLVCVILAIYAAWRKNKRSRKLILGPAPACDDTIEGLVKSGPRKKKVILLGILTSVVLVLVDGSQNIDVDLPSFSVAKIARHTNHFSDSNKHGKCGFGPVYKKPEVPCIFFWPKCVLVRPNPANSIW